MFTSYMKYNIIQGEHHHVYTKIHLHNNRDNTYHIDTIWTGITKRKTME